jgi:hypothetical protein
MQAKVRTPKRNLEQYYTRRDGTPGAGYQRKGLDGWAGLNADLTRKRKHQIWNSDKEK